MYVSRIVAFDLFQFISNIGNYELFNNSSRSHSLDGGSAHLKAHTYTVQHNRKILPISMSLAEFETRPWLQAVYSCKSNRKCMRQALQQLTNPRVISCVFQT